MANLETISTFIYKFQKSQPQLSFMTHNCRPIIHTCWFFNTIKKLLKFLKNIDLFLLFKIPIWSSGSYPQFSGTFKVLSERDGFLLQKNSFAQGFLSTSPSPIWGRYLNRYSSEVPNSKIPVWYISFLNRILFFSCQSLMI